ncbi:hypothetical protein C7C46_01465 [Streptomyces tateyamensis]|uniref:SMP-30/Gluconolactonase/LRE-like region domain-containing protein n=1 Tax=Streptomyces tateyamensis TaxID=565073 RepID=A0A2V4P3D6_9ACTN|nr:SMP-30/gluconolactonase/LRE family protein [Streptomyces tateyamensis]PYC88141.1 hypothetical protein C7C46_01465 [Streptomyces tateyamensis]
MNGTTRRTAVAAALAAAAIMGGALPAVAADRAPGAVAPAAWYGGAVAGTGNELNPESASWDPTSGRFVISSIHQGVVSTVGPDGVARTLVADPTLVSVIGVKVDAARGRVLVCNADPAGLSVRSTPGSQGHVAGLGSYDLRTGARRWYVDLAAVAADGGPHMANDVVFDADGTAYVTDSFSPIVYQVTADGRASVLLRDTRLGAGAGQFGLNGIVLRDSRLYLGNYQNGAIWEVPVHRLGALRLLVQDPRLVGLDGLTAGPDGTLLGATNRIGTDSSGQVVTVRQHHGQARLSVANAPVPAPTAVTKGPDGAYWVLSGRMDVLFAGGATDEFRLVRLPAVGR